MTPEDPESRRVAEALERRERRRPETEAPPVDPATLAALFEKHEGEVTRIIGEAEEALAEKIDKLVAAQDAAAERLRREISGSVKGDFDEKIAAAEGRLREEQRAALAWMDQVRRPRHPGGHRRGRPAAGNRHLAVRGGNRESGARRVLGTSWQTGHPLHRGGADPQAWHDLHDRGHEPLSREKERAKRQGASGRRGSGSRTPSTRLPFQ